ncbi:MAG: nucleoside triphosphate pyrophosphohydrolase family protein [Alphaproteobacteria bacterium]|nr:nucleoside triphosphate pyrophosphohydrolase family protein [Alphaproteobacteria bacterium]
MSSNYQKVRQYHEKFALPLDLPVVPETIANNRIKFIQEEVDELKQAVADNNRLKTLDALADILCVVYGAAAEYGFDMDTAFDRVFKSNMSKSKPADGIGKLVKGPDYVPVDLTDLV